MKKFLSVVLVCLILLAALPAGAENDISVILDGEPIAFDVKPMMIEGRVMVPLRAIFEAFGVAVDYDGETRKITAYPGESTIVLTVDSKEMYIGDRLVTLDVPATVIDGRTLVPVRAVSEALDCDVQWDQDTYSVIITSNIAIVDLNPIIDLSDDKDGKKKAMLIKTRYYFEQTTMPKLIAEGGAELSNMMMNDPTGFVAQIDNVAWSRAMNTIIINQLIDGDEVHVISSEDDLYALLADMADRYSLHAYQNYNADAMMLGDNYYIILYLAEIEDALTIGKYAAIVCSPRGEMSYFLMEQSFDGYYMLSSPTVDGHKNYGLVEGDLEAFLTGIETILENGKTPAAVTVRN
ncbi:MAG: hypothetical protein J1F63_06820 [Oscillospiraceae bacterium]|nr:hypothetical protein [Oscillospiraceae bacterium]